MTTILKSTTLNSTDSIQLIPGTTSQRPNIFTSIIQWTNTGSQAYSVLAGSTPSGITATNWTAPTGVTQIEVLVVAGGGAGGGGTGGGGGAGGIIYNSSFSVIPGNSYTVTVGAGGSPGVSTASGGNGNNSVFGTLTAIGGGGGGGANALGGTGGSGGGSGNSYQTAGGSGTAGQGFNGGAGGVGTGGSGSPYQSGGGGGAGGPGASTFTAATSTSGAYAGGGGPGLNFSISGTPTWYGGGGGGGSDTARVANSAGAGGIGGGGRGGNGDSGVAGTASTGGGGGGGANYPSQLAGSAGGSGIVIIKYSVYSDGATDPTGMVRYNDDVKDLEIYQGPALGWVAQDSTKNFGGHNLLTYSEQLDNGIYDKQSTITVSANTINAPDGTATAETVAKAASSGYGYLRQTGLTTPTNPTAYTFSVFVKKNTSSTVGIRAAGGLLYDNVTAGSLHQVFNFDSGTFTVTQVGYTSTSAYQGNGWWRLSVTNIINSTNSSGGWSAGIGIVQPSTGAENWDSTSSGVLSVYAWGFQLEQSSTPGPYVRTLDSKTLVPTSTGGYRYHAYTTVGTSGFSPAVTGDIEVLVVAGGGGGGSSNSGNSGGGGGGAGGVIYSQNYHVIAGRQYTVVVGAGGAGDTYTGSTGIHAGTSGSNSQFGNLIAIGGGFGSGCGAAQSINPGNGGTGGGAHSCYGSSNPLTNYVNSSTRPVQGNSIIGQGYNGGLGYNGTDQPGEQGGGGGGAGGPGQMAVQTNNTTYGNNGGGGGGGLYFPQFTAWGSPPGFFGGGGGGGMFYAITAGSPGGVGGGGTGGGGNGAATSFVAAGNGVANTGGGGGGGSAMNGGGNSGGNGGSGIVIIRYKYD
jgi:hypothetical protein